MFGVRSPLITPPKVVLTVVKLPMTTPPNPCTDARGSCVDAAELTNRVATRIAPNTVVRIVLTLERWRRQSGQESYPCGMASIIEENPGSLRRLSRACHPSTTIG